MLLTYFLKYIKLENNPLKRAKIKHGEYSSSQQNKVSAKYFGQTDVRANNLWSTLSDAQQLNKAD